MRVATTFTGAAACAAAFAPAATAATHPAAHHPTYAPFPVAKNLALQGMARATTGSIRSASCTTARKNWVHVWWTPTNGFSSHETCVGFKGKLTGLSISMFAQCGGNNHGKFFPGGLTYGPGTTYRNFTPSRFVSAISDAGWAGTNACPF